MKNSPGFPGELIQVTKIETVAEEYVCSVGVVLEDDD